MASSYSSGDFNAIAYKESLIKSLRYNPIEEGIDAFFEEKQRLKEEKQKLENEIRDYEQKYLDQYYDQLYEQELSERLDFYKEFYL